MDADKLFNLISNYGNVIRIKILHNKPDHALIQMADPFQAELAVYHLKVGGRGMEGGGGQEKEEKRRWKGTKGEGKGWWERGRKGGWEGGREGGREEGRERGLNGGRVRGWEGGRAGGKEWGEEMNREHQRVAANPHA